MRPHRFDFVRTELVYVPEPQRREYIERMLDQLIAPGGRLILCSYGSTRSAGPRVEPIVDQLEDWGTPVAQVMDTMSREHGFVITRVVAVESRARSTTG